MKMENNIINLEVRRVKKESDYTIGQLFVNGEYFCDTLEDEIRQVKVMHETAIPAGTYKVTLERSPRFKRILPLLHNVPGFTGILIHSGNTDKHTSGCILVGKSTGSTLINSLATLEKLMSILQKPKNLICTIKIS